MSASTIIPYPYGNSDTGSPLVVPQGWAAASDTTLSGVEKAEKGAPSPPPLHPGAPPQHSQHHAVDGGVRLAGGESGSDDELLPPMYQPSHGTASTA